MQNNNRLGCLTGTGIFAAFITIAVLIGVALTSGAWMFSAGELNAQPGDSIGGVNSHAQIVECSACHALPLFSTKMNDLCLQCHQDVALQMFDVTSLHHIVMKNDPAANCRECHPEHRGASAPLTEFDAANFPHEALGYALSGHQKTVLQQPFQCNDCHKDGYKFALATCDQCHRQMDSAFMASHLTQFGAECLACHDGVDRYGKNFDHASFFPLEGKHANMDCAQCHVNAHSAADFKSAAGDCSSCHLKDDAHAGAYGTACGVCHSPAAWKPAKFDHNLAVFKLEGKHANVKCEACHVNNVYKGTPQDCYSCHQKDDKHNGTFGKACETCHTSANWTGATFDHNLAVFKLDGAHVNVKCEKCHANNVFKGTPQDCYTCHQKDDEHNDLNGTSCASCHNTKSWDDVTEFDHGTVNFPLTGGHAGLQCQQCHKVGTFKGLTTACVSCHADPDFHAGAFGTQCETCHTIAGWSPAGFNFSHPEPRTDEGGSGVNHGSATCRQCHPATVYQATCDACHRGGFEGGGGGDD